MLIYRFQKANKEWVGVGAIYASVESMKLVFNVEVKKAPGRWGEFLSLKKTKSKISAFLKYTWILSRQEYRCH